MVTIYGLYDPTNPDEIKYIGKTKANPKNRLNQHKYQWTREKRLTKLNAWIKSLSNKGLLPEMQILDECEEKDWTFFEKHYIKLFKSFGANLKNMTEGGEDKPSACFSEESKQKRLESLKTSEAWKEKHIRHSGIMKELYKDGKILQHINRNPQKKEKIIKPKRERKRIIEIMNIFGEVFSFKTRLELAKFMNVKNCGLNNFLKEKPNEIHGYILLEFNGVKSSFYKHSL